MEAAGPARERVGIVLECEGMGDCLFAQAVIKVMKGRSDYAFDLFTRQPGLFKGCPYVDRVFPLDSAQLKAYPHKTTRLFELEKMSHWLMDTFDFISFPLGLGNLSFREKQLEYFPTEPDRALAFDVVLNTSMTWLTRSWPLDNWQRLAGELLALGLRVAVVGKDVESAADGMAKRSPQLQEVTNLVNQLSLDQTYYTLRKAGLFVTGQNGLSVLAGATDTRIVVLGMSIEWSKRAIYRRENPHHKATYVGGTCDLYCGRQNDCLVPEHKGELRCVPGYEAVRTAVLAAVNAHLRRGTSVTGAQVAVLPLTRYPLQLPLPGGKVL
jgi:ADP-heptose:LPS heptosyltransferase